MIDRVIQINNKQIVISQDLTLSHAGTVWDGALTMVHYWNKNKHIAQQFLSNKTVLELGSGTGIVGISASTFNPKKVYLTDLGQFLKILQINIDQNAQVCSKSKVQVRRLQWDTKEDMQSMVGIDTVIGSQLAYDKQNVIRLMNTIKYYKSLNAKLKVMIAYQKYSDSSKNLQIKFAQYFGEQYKCVMWQNFDEDYRDKQIGIVYIQ